MLKIFSRLAEIKKPTLQMLRDFHDYNMSSVVLWADFNVNYFNSLYAPRRRLSFTKNRLFMSTGAFHFRKKSILRHVINEKLDLLRESGILDLVYSEYVDNRRIKTKKQATQKVFHITNVFGALIICAAVCLFGIIIFLLEMISAKYPR